MDKTDVRNIINRLAEQEDTCASIYQEQINSRTWDTSSQSKKAQIALVIEKDGNLLFQEKRGKWGTSPRTTPVLLLLLHHPLLFVDFGAWPEKEFIEQYGITANQMAKLAKADFVIPSLYYYDSYFTDRKKDPEKAHSYEQEKNHHLLPLYENDETHIRIASKRRRAMFKSFGIDEEDASSSKAKWEHLFAPKLEKLKGLPLKDLIGYDENDFLHKSCVNFEYIKILGQQDLRISQFCTEVENRTGGRSEELIDELRVINGFKTRLASPLTAAYGGTYNMSAANYRNLEISSKLLPATQNSAQDHLQSLSEQDQEILKALASTKLMQAAVDEALPPLEFPMPPKDEDVDRYIEFLKEHENIPQKISSIIEEVRRCKNPQDQLSNWTEYLYLMREAHLAVTNDMKWSPVVFPLALQSTASTLAFILGISNPIGLLGTSLIGACTGHFLAAKYIKYYASEDPQWRLVTKLNELDFFVKGKN